MKDAGLSVPISNGQRTSNKYVIVRKPFIVGVGGTKRTGLSSELALRMALQIAGRQGALVDLVAGDGLDLELYDPDTSSRSRRATEFVELLRRADGLVVSAAAYHGGISGMLKNAIDYAEDLRGDDRPYLDGHAVGCIICAQGSQAFGPALANMRSIVHALRGWNTPFSATVNSAEKPFADQVSESVLRQLETVASQVVQFATMRVAWYGANPPDLGCGSK